MRTIPSTTMVRPRMWEGAETFVWMAVSRRTRRFPKAVMKVAVPPTAFYGGEIGDTCFAARYICPLGLRRNVPSTAILGCGIHVPAHTPAT